MIYQDAKKLRSAFLPVGSSRSTKDHEADDLVKLVKASESSLNWIRYCALMLTIIAGAMIAAAYELHVDSDALKFTLDQGNGLMARFDETRLIENITAIAVTLPAYNATGFDMMDTVNELITNLEVWNTTTIIHRVFTIINHLGLQYENYQVNAVPYPVLP